ncbi:NAD-dependent epimerase/dehydratase family protein [Methylobacterium komagatae]
MADVLVTGAGGVLGNALVQALEAEGTDFVAVASRQDCNLENYSDTLKLFESCQPKQVYHLAGAVYGVGGNMAYPGDIFRRNTLINCNVVEAARTVGATRFLGMGTVAMYADGLPMPLREDDVLSGQPHSSERFYAFAKRGLLMQLESYRLQYGMDYVMALSTNLYGPGDRFDPEHGHVIPSLIHKFVESRNKEPVSVWGDGSPTRDFLYSRDAADGLLLLMKSGSGVYNLASGRSITIRTLVETLAGLVPEATYAWDVDKPLGQLRRAYDISRLSDLGFVARTELRDGLSETLNWYLDNLGHVRS